MSQRQTPVAIVGLGALFPDAPTLERFWENLAARRCAAREVPEGRWLLAKDDVYHPEKGRPDRVYSLKACFVEGFRFDPEGLALDPELLARLDPVYHFALHAARAAARDAKLGRADGARVGVSIGNIVLPTDASSRLARELLDPVFEERVLGRRSSPFGLKTEPLNRCVAGLPAGLIARALGLGGPAFTLDAACASSLYALKLAVDELTSGRADAMLTGGVSRPESLYTQMGFSQLRALSAKGVPSPFDEGADGLVVGEGAGIFVLKRLDDALRDGDKVYATIAGIGLSNDVGGSLLAPNTVGQLRAMREAYRRAGWSPSQVDYVECHATGTPTGDPIEVASLKALWGERGWTAGQCALGSVKSNVGHLLTAAGSAGLAKLLLALKHKTLPPTANYTKPGPLVGLDASPFRVQTEAAPWERRPDGAPRRAAVSAFGFGGINAHVLIEEHVPAAAPKRAKKPQAAAPAVAVVGIEARFGALTDARMFQERALGSAEPAPTASPDRRWWGIPGAEGWKAHLLPEVALSQAKYRIPPKEMEEMLPQQMLMLDVARAAIDDFNAGRALGANARPEGAQDGALPGADRCGVFIGLGLDLNTTNFHFRWSLLAKARAWAKERGLSLSPEDEAALVSRLRDAAGPALSANRTMGALGGIVASRIAREFHVGGPSFTLSSEETSGLRALETAVRALQNGELDSAIVGAVDIAGDARAALAADAQRAFARDGRARPLDPASSGAAIGEGAAAFVLKRLEDAVRDGDRVYCVVKGAGAASGDGAYAAALRRAYAEAGVDPSTVGLLEAHASGFPEEDEAEARALADFFGTAQAPLPCALGRLKAQIGHAGAAAGLAGLARAALALYQEVLPPSEPFTPREPLARAKARFFAPQRAQYWLRNRAEGPRRAGVSALGVDGTAAHVVLEAYEPAAPHAASAAERAQPLGARSEGLFVLEADEPAALLAGIARLRDWLSARETDENIESLARAWYAREPRSPRARRGLAVVARGWKELLGLLQLAGDSIRENPDRPIPSDRVHYTSRETFGERSLAFVFPGSGNQYLGMGVEAGAQWPEVLRRLDAENGYLRRQLVPERYAPWRLTWEPGWEQHAESELLHDYKSMIFGSVSHGVLMSDILRLHGAEPAAVIGYSLGETAGLFALRAWTDRDEMLRRMDSSSLFVSDLAGPCDAARQFWNLPKDEKVEWVLGVIDRPADNVKRALKGMNRAALLIVNAPLECVVGGYRKAVQDLVEGLGCVFLPLQGVSTVHFPAAKLVEKQYRDLHLFPTTAPQGVRFYSGAWGKSYELTRETAADSITAQAVRSFDFSKLIRRAYDDGLRVFVELGPQGSCTRMIGKILAPLPHAARSVCQRGQEPVGSVLRTLALLVAERLPVDLDPLYGRPTLCVGHRDRKPAEPRVHGTLGGLPFSKLEWTPSHGPGGSEIPKPRAAPAPSAPPPSRAPVIRADNRSRPAPASLRPDAVTQAPAGALASAFASATTATAKAHEVFLRMSASFAANQARNLSLLSSGAAVMPAPAPAKSRPTEVPRALTREQCLEFAVGRIGDVLGETFAHADAYPTRVRLPAEPLMLVDRITEIEGEPRSLKSGRVVTEHDVKAGAWYLDAGRIPTCVAVEAGQADLFLSGYLGIDERTQGLAVYRLLDAEIVFHSELPKVGEVIRYDIHIDRFVRHGDIWLFFFRFESTVAGRPLLTMRNGCAGFFTQEELARGKGVVLTDEEKAPAAGTLKGWTPLAPVAGRETLSDAQVLAFRGGDFAGAFGSAFARLPFTPEGLPQGLMKLVDRVLELEPSGGRWGLGRILAEADIRPDDWHLVCHFKGDNVMPGTLMYECCLHTLRVLLARLGVVGEAGKVHYEPVKGAASRLKCRGQVLASTKKVRYEVSIKELGYDAEGAPYALADAFMYSDEKNIVHIENMSLRLSGTDRRSLESIWKGGESRCVPERKILFDTDKITAFAIGKPSEAFGKPYEVFDSERIIARLPGPPYQFLDRIVGIEGCEPFKLAAGGEVVAEYDVPPNEWYFAANGQPTMPFAVLLEVALQPCGWLAAYLGSALTSPIDLKFRNLGGTATQLIDVTPDIGTLTTKVKLTKVAQSGGMIIQDFALEMTSPKGLVYKGITEFGFFTKESLAQQVGVRGAKPFAPAAPGRLVDPKTYAGMPDPRLLLLDEVELGADWVRGSRKVDPGEWFFKAHFYQDPVCPGSLGLESFVECLKVWARERWGAAGRFESMTLGKPHTWLYRGQYTPVNKLVRLSAKITKVDDARKELVADGHLTCDGITIYQMKDFGLRLL